MRTLDAARLFFVVVLVLVGVSACASSDPEVEATVERVEDELAERVVPALKEDVDSEAVWKTFNQAIQTARTEEMHVVRGPDSSVYSSETGTILASVVTIVGPDSGECLAVAVGEDGTVESTRVSGDPARNCEGAQVPDPGSL